MSITEDLIQASRLIERSIRAIENSDITLPGRTLKEIVHLQTTAVRLRDEAISLHYEAEWTLEAIGVAFEISPSRASQIARRIKLSRTKRHGPRRQR